MRVMPMSLICNSGNMETVTKISARRSVPERLIHFVLHTRFIQVQETPLPRNSLYVQSQDPTICSEQCFDDR